MHQLREMRIRCSAVTSQYKKYRPAILAALRGISDGLVTRTIIILYIKTGLRIQSTFLKNHFGLQDPYKVNGLHLCAGQLSQAYSVWNFCGITRKQAWPLSPILH
jgi:hypothetical protein